MERYPAGAAARYGVQPPRYIRKRLNPASAKPPGWRLAAVGRADFEREFRQGCYFHAVAGTSISPKYRAIGRKSLSW
jgi:hypothetical protein